MSVNKYHMVEKKRVDNALQTKAEWTSLHCINLSYLGATSHPIHITAAHAHHKEWFMYRFCSISSGFVAISQGSSRVHSIGVNLDYQQTYYLPVLQCFAVPCHRKKCHRNKQVWNTNTQPEGPTEGLQKSKESWWNFLRSIVEDRNSCTYDKIVKEISLQKQ